MIEKRKKKEPDFSITAFKTVKEVTEGTSPNQEKPLSLSSKNPNAVILGRLGGLKGGNARAKKLTPERRKEIAQKAASTRWHKNG